MTLHNPHRGGYTFLEFAIVMLIVGLLTGALLVGKEMIFAARIRGQLNALGRYDAAVSNFRNKYTKLPGDLPARLASLNGFITRSGARGHGDGNGLLEYCDPITGSEDYLGCETAFFWTDLSQAKLIAETFTSATDVVTFKTTSAATTLTELKSYLPVGSIDNTTPIQAISNITDSSLWYALGFAVYYQNGMALGVYASGTLAPYTTAYYIDLKVDDGNPLTGSVKIGSGSSTYATSGQTTGFFGTVVQNDTWACVSTTGTYNINNTSNACQLLIKSNISEDM